MTTLKRCLTRALRVRDAIGESATVFLKDVGQGLLEVSHDRAPGDPVPLRWLRRPRSCDAERPGPRAQRIRAKWTRSAGATRGKLQKRQPALQALVTAIWQNPGPPCSSRPRSSLPVMNRDWPRPPGFVDLDAA
mgnify:CR=1 FL=1